MKTTTYGQKGGEGPTRGRKATTYTATAPDGSVLTKRSYFTSADTAVMGAYEHEGKWYAASVHADQEAMKAARCDHYTKLEARRAP